MGLKLDEKIEFAVTRGNVFYMPRANKDLAPIYPFTTENISGYYKYFDFKDKDILMVCGSGDQAINAILKGARKITLFDINPLCREYFNLKVAAVKALTLKEFKSFFCYYQFFGDSYMDNNRNAMDIKLYLKLSPYLDEKTKFFWDTLYYECISNFRESNSLFNSDEYAIRHLIYYNDYFNDESYNRLKTMFNRVKIRFIDSDIKGIARRVYPKKYDYIFLSNIIKYVDGMYQKNGLLQFRNLIYEMKKILNSNGKIMCGYLYDPNLNDYYVSYDWPSIYDKEKRDYYFKDVEYYEFPSMDSIRAKVNLNIDINEKDAIMVYKK